MAVSNQAANDDTRDRRTFQLLQRLLDAMRHKNTAVASQALAAADDVSTFVNSHVVLNNDRRCFSTCLHLACVRGHVKIVRLLIDREADVTALDFRSWTPLHRACASGVDADAKVECLLQHGAASQVNARDDLGETALHKAAWRGRSHSVKLLLQHGALVDAKSNVNATSLQHACVRGHVACLHELVKHGADFKSRHNRMGLTPLQMAAFYGHVECVKALLDYGADINAPDVLNRPALFHAVIRGHVDIIATLLAHAHCDVTIKDAHGKTALDFASSREVKTLLLGQNFPSSRQA